MDDTTGDRISSLRRKYDEACNVLDSETLGLKKARLRLSDLLEAQDIAQRAAEQVQKQAHSQICRIVSMCLEAVFDDPYEFRINFERKRGKTEANLVFVRDGEIFDDPLHESGGGQVDVASFALRISSLLLSRPVLRRFVVMDQPFPNVSEEKGYIDRIPEMILNLSKQFKIQFFIVTHIDELKIGKIVQL